MYINLISKKLNRIQLNVSIRKFSFCSSIEILFSYLQNTDSSVLWRGKNCNNAEILIRISADATKTYICWTKNNVLPGKRNLHLNHIFSGIPKLFRLVRNTMSNWKRHVCLRFPCRNPLRNRPNCVIYQLL